MINSQLVHIPGFPKACSHKYLHVPNEDEREEISRRLRNLFTIEFWFQDEVLIVAKWYYSHCPTWSDIEHHLSYILERTVKLRYI